VLEHFGADYHIVKLVWFEKMDRCDDVDVFAGCYVNAGIPAMVEKVTVVAIDIHASAIEHVCIGKVQGETVFDTLAKLFYLFVHDLWF